MDVLSTKDTYLIAHNGGCGAGGAHVKEHIILLRTVKLTSPEYAVVQCNYKNI
mgnify:CR=1 FL=1